MKKILTLALALCLLACAAALAENVEITEPFGTGSTTVTYTVDVCSDFVLTIPPSVVISSGETRADLEIELDASNYNDTTRRLDVTVGTRNDFTMDNAIAPDAQISYGLIMDNGTSNGDRLGIGRTFMSYQFVPGSTAPRVQSMTLHIEVDDSEIENAAAETYSDSLTFMVLTTQLSNG